MRLHDRMALSHKSGEGEWKVRQHGYPNRRHGAQGASRARREYPSITVEPPGPGSFSCPSGQSSVLACVSYTDILLTDTTNNLDVVPTGTTSRTFISAKGISCA